MKAEKQSHTSNSEEQLSILSRSLLTGFVGGIALGCAWCILYYFNLSEVSPKFFVLGPWTTAGWIDTWIGHFITIIIVGLLSMVAALIYHGAFKKIYSMWMGAVYGIIVWGIIFILMQPIFSNVINITEMELNTILSTVCLFILYGTFVGYSISYDYYDLKVRLIKKADDE